MEAVFTTTIFETLLFEGRLVFWSAQRATRSESVEISKKNTQKIEIEINQKNNLKDSHSQSWRTCQEITNRCNMLY